MRLEYEPLLQPPATALTLIPGHRFDASGASPKNALVPSPKNLLTPSHGANGGSSLDPQPSILNPQPSTLNPQPSTFHPQPSTLNPQPSTFHPQPSTLNPHPVADPTPQEHPPRTRSRPLQRMRSRPLNLHPDSNPWAQTRRRRSITQERAHALSRSLPEECAHALPRRERGWERLLPDGRLRDPPRLRPTGVFVS